MSLEFLEWPVRKQLAVTTSPLQKARIKVLAYALHLRFITTVVLLCFYLARSNAFHAMRVSVLLAIVTAICLLVYAGLHWRVAIHIAMIVCCAILWANLFWFENGLNVVSLQYVAIISTCAFYGLGKRWGLSYSLISLLPFVLTFFLNGIDDHLPWGPTGTSDLGVVILLAHNFLFLILINYYFFSSFYNTIKELDGSSKNLTQDISSLERSRVQLEEELVHQKYLLASISHDIKSPLRFLMTTTSRLARNHPELPTVRAISQSSSRLYNFMKNLLEYTEIRYKSSAVTFSYLDLNELVSEKIAYFLPEAENNSNALINEVEVGVILKSNPQLVGIILHNLIDNANKAAYDGEIHIRCEDHRNEMRLTVSDTGHGMDAHIMDWINGAAKVPGEEHNSQSFGMGLLIVKEVSSLIRARLYAEACSPTGTSVHVIFSKNNLSS